MRRLDEAQAGIKIARRNINNLRYADDTALMAQSEEDLKNLLIKEESEKAGLKFNIQKTKVIASGPITSWQIDGETMKTVKNFILGSSKITAKQKQHPAVDVTGDRSKVRCCKEQHCIGTRNVRSMNRGKLDVVKQEMARVIINTLGISELKWM